MMRWLKDKKRERRPASHEEGGKEEKEDDYGFEKEKPASKSPSSRRQLPPPPVAPEEKSPHIYEEIPDIPSSERAEYERALLQKFSRHKKNQNGGGKDGSQGDKGKNSSSSSAGKDEISPYMVVPVDTDVRQTPTNFHRNGTPEVHCDVIVKDTHCEILLTRKPKVGAFRLDSTAAGGETNSSYTRNGVRNNTHFCSHDRRASMEVRGGPGKATSAFNIATSSSAFSASSSSSSKANSMSMSNLSERQYPMQKVCEERDDSDEPKGVETYTTASNFIPRATNLTFHPLNVGSTNTLGSGSCGFVYGKASMGSVNNLNNNNNSSSSSNVNINNNNSNSNNEDGSFCVTYSAVREQNNSSNCVSYASVLEQNPQGSCVTYASIQEQGMSPPSSNQSFFYQSIQNQTAPAYQGGRDAKPTKTIAGSLSLSSNLNSSLNLNSNLSSNLISGGGVKTGVIRPSSPSASSTCTYASVNFPCEPKHYNTIADDILPPEVTRGPDMDPGHAPDDPKDDPNVIYSSIDGTFGFDISGGRGGQFYGGEGEMGHDVMYAGITPYSLGGVACSDISYGHCCQDNNNNNNSSNNNNNNSSNNNNNNSSGNNNCISAADSMRGSASTVPYNAILHRNSNTNNNSNSSNNGNNDHDGSVTASANLLLSSRFCGKNLALEFCTCSDDQHSSSCDCPDAKPFDDAASVQAEGAGGPSSCNGCGRLIRQITYSESLSDETYEHVYASRLLLRTGRRFSSPDITFSEISNAEFHDIPNSRSPEFMNAVSRDDTWMTRSDDVMNSAPPKSLCGRNDDVAVSETPTLAVPATGGSKYSASRRENAESAPHRRGRSTERRTHSALLRKKEHPRIERSLETKKPRRSSEHFSVPSSKTNLVLPLKGTSTSCPTQRKSAVELLEPKTNAFSGLFSRFSRSRSKQRKAENSEPEATPGIPSPGTKPIPSEPTGTSGDRDLEEIPEKNTKKLSKFFQKLSLKDGVREFGDNPPDVNLDPISKPDSFYHAVACSVAVDHFVDSEPQASTFLPAAASQLSGGGGGGDLPQDFPDAHYKDASKRESQQLAPSAAPFEKDATLDAAAPAQTEALTEASGVGCKPTSKTDSGDTCYEYDVSTSSEGEQPSHDCILSKFKVAGYHLDHGCHHGARRKKPVCKRCRPAVYSTIDGLEEEDANDDYDDDDDDCPHLSMKYGDLSAILGDLVVDQRAAILNCLTDYTHTSPYGLKGQGQGQGQGQCRECGCEIVTSDSESLTTVYSVLSQQYHVTSPGAHTPSCDSDEGTMADNSGESADENENDSSGYDEPGISAAEQQQLQQQQQQQQQRLSSHKVKKKDRSKEKKEKRGGSGHAHNMAKDQEKLRKKLAVEIICAEIGEAGKGRRRHAATLSDSPSHHKLGADAGKDATHGRGGKSAHKKGVGAGGGGGGREHHATGMRVKEETDSYSKGDYSKGNHSKGDHSKGNHSKGDYSKGNHSKGDHSKFCEITKTKSSLARDRAIQDIYAPLPAKALSLLTCRQKGPHARVTCTCGHGGVTVLAKTTAREAEQGEGFRNKDGAGWGVQNEAAVAMESAGVSRVHSRDRVGEREGVNRSEEAFSNQGGGRKGGEEPKGEGHNRLEVNGGGGQRGEGDRKQDAMETEEMDAHGASPDADRNSISCREEEKKRSGEAFTKTTETASAGNSLTNSNRQKQQQQQQQQQQQETRSEVKVEAHKISLRRLQRIQPSTFDLLPETALGGDVETSDPTLNLKPAKKKMVETLARMYESHLVANSTTEPVAEAQGKGKGAYGCKDLSKDFNKDLSKDFNKDISCKDMSKDFNKDLSKDFNKDISCKDISKDTSSSHPSEQSSRAKSTFAQGLAKGRAPLQDSSECKNDNSGRMEEESASSPLVHDHTSENSRSGGRKECSENSGAGGGGAGKVVVARSLNTVEDHPKDSPSLNRESLCEASRGPHLNANSSARDEEHGATETVSAASEKVGVPDASDSYDWSGKAANSDLRSNAVKIIKQKSPSPSSSSSSSKRKGVKHKRMSKKSYHRKRSKSRSRGESRREEKTYYYFSSDMSDLDVVEVEDWQTYSSAAAQSRPVSRSESKNSETDDAMAGVTPEKAGRAAYSRAGTDDEAMQEIYAIPSGSAELRGGRAAADGGNSTQRGAETPKQVKTKRTDVYKTRRGNNRLLSDLIIRNYDRQLFGGNV